MSVVRTTWRTYAAENWIGTNQTACCD